jgi:hypothetical protein
VVVWWLLKLPNPRPTVILPVVVESFQSYRARPDQVLQRSYPCPACKTRTASRHGVVLRWVYFLDRREQIPLYRLRCRPCRVTSTLLPDFLRPHVRYALEIVEAAVDACLDGASCRTTALVLSGVTLPKGPNITDALSWTRLVPGYQRVHAWLAHVAAAATADVREAAAWIVRRKPDALAVDHLTAPARVPGPGNHLPSKQLALAAAGALARLFCDPFLDPAKRGWMRAWQHFAAWVLGRPPWRCPPRASPEPPTSRRGMGSDPL